jgi:hypothetical protein
MYGGRQQTPAPLMRPAIPNYSSNSGSQQGETPYHGHNLHTPFVGSESSSQSQLQVPSTSGGGSCEEYQQIYSHPSHQQQAAARIDPYHCTPNTIFDDQIQDLNATVAHLISDVARLTDLNQCLLESVQHVYLINGQMSVANEALTIQVNVLEEVIKALQVESEKLHKKATGKHISNDHPALKVRICMSYMN